MRETLRLKEAAHELGLHERTLRRMIKSGRLPAEKTGTGGKTSPIVIRKADVWFKTKSGS